MSTITTINGTDTIASTRSVINTNFNNLDTDKVESSTTSVDNEIARFDGTTGKTIQRAPGVTITDGGQIVSASALGGFSTTSLTLQQDRLFAPGTNASVNIQANGTGSIRTNNALWVRELTTTVAGGDEFIRLGASAIRICFGSGAPTLSAPQGSLYLRTDGSSTSTRMYVNTNGSTGWTSVTTAT